MKSCHDNIGAAIYVVLAEQIGLVAIMSPLEIVGCTTEGCAYTDTLSLQARQIQRDVHERKELEYRLRAFTGDDVTSALWDSKSKTKNAPR